MTLLKKVGQASSLSAVARKTGWTRSEATPYAILLCLFLVGCSKQAAETTTLSAPVYTQQYRNQAATVIVSLSKTNLPTSGQVRLMLEVHADQDAVVELPPLYDAIAPFTVADGYTEPLQELPDGRRLLRQCWNLYPALPGTSTFQPLSILIDGAELKTDPIQLQVESILPPELEHHEIRDIAETLPLQTKERKQSRIVIAVAFGLIGLILLALFIRAHKKRNAPEKQLPHEVALFALAQLPDDEVEKIHAINRILKQYIEARFSIALAGKTVEEASSLVASKMPGIQTFLTACEQVRFSNVVPDGFSAKAIQFVHQCIEKTREAACD